MRRQPRLTKVTLGSGLACPLLYWAVPELLGTRSGTLAAAHNVCLVVGFVQLFSCCSLVDANHSNTNWPCTVLQLAYHQMIKMLPSTYALPMLSLR
jgi:hypothetical protein